MKKIIQFLHLAISLLFLASCGATADKREKKERTAEVIYKTVTLQKGSMSGSIRLPGVVQSFQSVQLFPKISGFVKAVNVDRGSNVRKGQVLLLLEAPEIEQQVAAAKLKYTQAQAMYMTSKDRYRRLLETSKTPGTISSYDLEAAASKMQGDSAIAQGDYANYKAQESMKGYLTVTAPFEGVVTERNVHPGALAGPQNAKPMLVLQQVSRLRLVVDIPEQMAAQVKDGDKVRYKFNALPGQEFTGVVSRSSQSLSNSYRSETIEIDVFNTGNIFKPGMFAEVLVPTCGSANAFIVPNSAIVTTTERKYVICVENNRANWKDITEGSRIGDSTEVFGAIEAGSRILANPSYTIKNGEVIHL